VEPKGERQRIKFFRERQPRFQFKPVKADGRITIPRGHSGLRRMSKRSIFWLLILLAIVLFLIHHFQSIPRTI
jgi:hypothetical protein